MDEPSSTELLLIACELATRVECRPLRDDGSEAAVYASSGATVARRIKAGAKFVASCSQEPQHHWDVALQANAARKTRYTVWLDASPGELRALWQSRKDAQALRDSLPHGQRKKKPWGLL